MDNQEKHICFISFKTEDEAYKLQLQDILGDGAIDRSLDEPIESDDEEYVIRKIREDYISKTTVTIFLIGKSSNELLGWDSQKYIKRELRASLFDGERNTMNGIVGIVLPEMHQAIYLGSQACSDCRSYHGCVRIDDTTTIREFSENFYIPHEKCSHQEDDRFCILASWEDFIEQPKKFIQDAFDKRTQPIAQKVIVRPVPLDYPL